MKISLHTIAQFFLDEGMDISQYIEEGFAEISGFSLNTTPTTKGIAILKQSENNLNSFSLSYKSDYIIIKNTNISTISNALNKMFIYYNTWYESLLNALIEDSSLQSIIEIAHDIFKRPMFIKSDSSWVYAITLNYKKEVHPDWEQLINSVTNKTPIFSSVEKVSMDPTFQTVFKQRIPIIIKSPFTKKTVLRTNVFVNKNRICEIVVLENGKPFTQSDLYILSTLSQIVEKYILKHSDIFLNYQNISVLFMDLLLGHEQSVSYLMFTRKMLNWSEDDNLAVFILHPLNPKETPMTGVMRDVLINNISACTVLSFEDNLVCVVNVTLNNGFNNLCNKLKKIIPRYAFRWGISYTFHLIADLKLYYTQANKALLAAEADKSFYRTMYQISFQSIVRKMDFDPSIHQYIHPDLIALKEYDADNSTDLYQTLYTYLLCGKNYTDTANILEIHRNTVINRINLIQNLFFLDLNDMNTIKLLLLSMFILDRN